MFLEKFTVNFIDNHSYDGNEKMKEILCTIVIPTYKGSESVKKTVESALRQEHVEIEIIVVDDNGKNTNEQIKTADTLKKYIENNQINYICHDVNRNGSAARNTGLAHSHGVYIAFLDDDDFLMPEKTKKQIEMLKNNSDCGMCVCSGCYVNRNGVGYQKILRAKDDFLYGYLLDKYYFNTSAILFRKDVLVEFGGFDESFRRHQDWELVTRVLSKYDTCIIEDVEMVRYLEGRNNPKSFNEQIENLEHFFSICEPYMLKKLTNEQVKKVKRFRRCRICQTMIRTGNVRQAVEYGRSYGGRFEFVVAALEMIPLLVRKLIYGSRKVAPAKDSLL